MRNLILDRRDLLLSPLFAAAVSSFGIGAAQAAAVDPTMTIVVPPDQIPWQPLYNFRQGAAEQAPMFGAIGEAGQYFVLIRWHSGFMSAPHWYETDRLCVVLSGNWYVASLRLAGREQRVAVGSRYSAVAPDPPGSTERWPQH